MNLPAAYWDQFRDQLKAELEAAGDADLVSAWQSPTARTAFYASHLFPKLALKLGLKIKTELFKVDWALCAKSSTDHLVPLIFVESENNAESASHEVRKLCSLSAPLKVLISCCTWCEDPGYWTSGGHRTRLLGEWKAIIRAQNDVWPSPCFYGIIIGERKGKAYRFYKVGLGANGDELDPEAILVERRVL